MTTIMRRFAAILAGRGAVTAFEFLSATAQVGHSACRNSDHERKRGYVGRDQRTRSDHAVSAYADAGQYRGVCPHRSPALNHNRPQPLLRIHVTLDRFPHSGRAGKAVVGERGIGADENVVLQCHAVPHAYIVLDRYVVSDDSACLQERVVAYVATASNANAAQHMRERPDSGPWAYVVGFHQRGRMNERFAHFQLPAPAAANDSNTALSETESSTGCRIESDWIATCPPWSRSDLSAASITSTTRKPFQPSVLGVVPLTIASM